MLDWLHSRVDGVVSQRIKKLKPPPFDDYYNSRDTKNDKIAYSFGIHSVMRDVTSALLTHISAMIAVLGIMLIVFKDTQFTKYFVMLEMVAYSFLALCCIFSMRWKGFVAARVDRTLEDHYQGYLRNRYIYQFCVDGVLWVTLLFIFTVLGHVIVAAFS